MLYLRRHQLRQGLRRPQGCPDHVNWDYCIVAHDIVYFNERRVVIIIQDINDEHKFVFFQSTNVARYSGKLCPNFPVNSPAKTRLFDLR